MAQKSRNKGEKIRVRRNRKNILNDNPKIKEYSKKIGIRDKIK